MCEMSWFAFFCSLLGLRYLALVGLLFPLSRGSGGWTHWLYRGNVSLLCGTSWLCSESISVRCSDGWGEGGLLRVGVRWCPHTSCTARAWTRASCSRFRSILGTGQRSGHHSGSLLVLEEAGAGRVGCRGCLSWRRFPPPSAASPECSGWGRAPPERLPQGGTASQS